MEFVKVEAGDRKAIEELSAMACTIVKEYYEKLLGSDQNDYMIEKFQSFKAITTQLDSGYNYYVLESDNEPVGFIGFYPNGKRMYLSKFYFAKSARGKGLGKKTLAFLVDKTRAKGLESIYLNVNKYNESIKAYEKMGFARIGEEVNDIGNGYVMDDYVYEYKLFD